MPWNTMSFGEITRFKNGKSIKPGLPGKFPVYGANGVIGGSDEYMYDSSVIVGRVGAYCGAVELCEGKFWASDNTIVAQANEDKITLGFLYYLLKDANLNRYAGGAAQPLLTQSRLKPIEFPVPPLAVQHRIASILSAYDDLIENNTRRIEILEEMARRLYEEWFVQFRFPGYEGVELKESGLGLIPEGWQASTLDIFGQIITGKTPSKKTPEFFGRDVPFIKLPDMHGQVFVIETSEGLSLEGEQSQKTKTIPPGSICVSCIGTGGVVVIASEFSQTNQQINSIVPRDSALREFLFFAVSALRDTINNYGATGATMTNLSRGKFASLQVIEPSGDVLLEYSKLVSPMFNKILSLQKINRYLRTQRDLLLPKLISGEIDVSDIPMPN